MGGRNILKLGASLALPLLAGAIGSVFVASSVDTWYAALVKPSLMPANFVFTPVWFALYLLMGVALFLVWRRGVAESGVKKALVAFDAQLILHILWSALFFGLESPLLGLVGIAALLLAIFYTVTVFDEVSRPAALLLLPYLGWVAFAAYLNYLIFTLN